MKAGKLFLAAVAMAGLAACTTVSRVNTAEVPNGYRIQCHGLANDLANCQERARWICPRGFHIVDQIEGVGRVVYYKRYHTSDVRRELVVVCL